MKNAKWQADLQQIRHLRLFNNVAASGINQLLKEFRACDLDAGEVLLSPFNRNQYLYLLLKGQLKVYLGSLDSQAVSTLKAGDCAGEGNRLILDSEQTANIDALTGAYNRRWLEHIFERESTRSAFNGKPLCMLMLDVDHFKAYNDQHGHLAGDYALCLVAHTLRNQLRPKDSLTRYGGEEFVILLPEIGIDEARSIGERLRLALRTVSSFHSPIGVLPGVTVSIGLAQMQPKDSLQGVIARADSALYQAKQQGRDGLCGWPLRSAARRPCCVKNRLGMLIYTSKFRFLA